MKVTTDACLLGAWAPVPSAGRFLDIGTGTGLLPLMMAQRSQGIIDAIEVEEDSCAQARENIEESKFRDRITLILADVMDYATQYNGLCYDFIICNPPFFQRQLPAASAKTNIARHDVRLNAGQLLSAVKNLLKPQEGKFSVLLPFRQAKEFISSAQKENLFLWEELLIRSKPRKAVIRCVMIFRPSPTQKIKSESLSIKDDEGNHTEIFSSLMRDFYLKV
ncbi:MAG: methyltransferase [Chitinophagales bacterium]